MTRNGLTVETAIMSDNRECRVMLYFTLEVFRCLATQIHGHIRVMLQYLFGSDASVALKYFLRCTRHQTMVIKLFCHKVNYLGTGEHSY